MPSVETIIDHLRLFRPNRHSALGDGWEVIASESKLDIDSSRLDAFHRVCPGWRDLDHLPPTYPQLAAASAHLKLLGTKGFPFHPMGLVHVTNEIEQKRPIHRDESLHVMTSVGPGGAHEKGRLIEVLTEIRSTSGEIPWRSRATALKMESARPSIRPSPKEKPLSDTWRDSITTRVDLGENLGRLYGDVAGDLNPIHQRAWLAKPFGFSRHIIHGTWTLAWALHPIVSGHSHYRLEAHFRRPVPLPSSLHATTRPTDDGQEVRVWQKSLWKPALEINLAF